ncbi:heat shock 70 kDa protein 4-like [Dreissena polymorpha]|uniref:Uncharacterized protein n=1 Tax=Dreissena polymorpha TaxID=45954 RepID=A0A9D4KHY8_DREPO|nr:heat shock 70 kDa protein 4-like [Dreissena polymorpha]KAH3839734.1 hypothetical protein DPMN_113168 [Dreissena polymorpha]
MAVVGLDVGNYSSYVAVAQGGGIDTVANEYSDRCTPAFVSLMENSRCMGVSAKNQSTTNVKNTISCFKRLLGRRFKDQQVQKEKNHYFHPYDIVEGPAGETLIQATYMGEKQNFTPEQIMAMLLTKLKDTGEKALRTKVVDCVVSVPSFFTDVERRAMIASCQMASLNCLKVMNDTTAVCLSYGIYKQDLPAENEKPRNVVFVDMGYCSMQVCVAAFNKGKLKVLAVQSDASLGGRDFDCLIINHFANDWKTKYKIDAFSRPKSYIRLEQESEKLKKLMSANTQQIPLDVECFMDDVDVHGKMDRAEFEEMAAPLLQRAEAMYRKILELTKLSLEDIYAVEVVGGSSRLPCVKELVTKVFQKEPSTTLNADEAVAKGCALQCAILSPTFRVRDFAIQDCQQYPITLAWQGGGMDEDSTMEVFPQFHAIPFSKMLTFFRKEPFSIEARYSNPAEVPIDDPGIGLFKITKVQPSASGESPKVKVKVRVNNHGMFTVQSASMVEKVEETKTTEEQGPETMETDAAKNNAENSANGSKSENNMETEQGPTNGDSSKNEEATNDEKADDAKGDKKTEEEEGNKSAGDKKEKKAKTRSIDLPVEPLLSQYSKDAINLMQERENQMIAQDRLEKERCDAKNAVEEYVYEMRDKLCGPYEEFATEEDREGFSKLLGDTEDWLYDEGENQNKQVYIDKLAELKKTGTPIQERYREAQERPVAFEALGAGLQHVRKFLAEVEAKNAKYDHLGAEDMEKVSKCLKEKQQWFEEQMNAQGKQKKYEKPTVLASQIRQNEQNLRSTCEPIITRPKPKPKEEPPKEDKKGEKTKEGDASTNAKQDGTKEPAGGDAKPEQANGPAQMDVD